MNILSAGTKKWPLYRGGCCKGLAVSGGSAVVCKKLLTVELLHCTKGKVIKNTQLR